MLSRALLLWAFVLAVSSHGAPHRKSDPSQYASKVFVQSSSTPLQSESWGTELASGSMNGYLTYNETVDLLHRLHKSFPHLVSALHVIGHSLEGRELWAVRMGPVDKPAVLFTALHHSREPASLSTVLYILLHLCHEHTRTTSELLSQRQIWFVPIVNPDGYVFNERRWPNGGGEMRKNRRSNCHRNHGDLLSGVDLNRNYGYKWAMDDEGSDPNPCDESYRGAEPFSEPETQSIRDLVLSINFTAAFNYHSYGNLLTYPYNYAKRQSDMPLQDVHIFEELVADPSFSHFLRKGSAYALLRYVANGESDDWMYRERGVISLSPEVGAEADGYWPNPHRILPIARENLASALLLIDRAGSSLMIETVTATVSKQNGCVDLVVRIVNRGLASSSPNTTLFIQAGSPVNLTTAVLSVTGINDTSIRLNLTRASIQLGSMVRRSHASVRLPIQCDSSLGDSVDSSSNRIGLALVEESRWACGSVLIRSVCSTLVSGSQRLELSLSSNASEEVCVGTTPTSETPDSSATSSTGSDGRQTIVVLLVVSGVALILLYAVHHRIDLVNWFQNLRCRLRGQPRFTRLVNSEEGSMFELPPSAATSQGQLPTNHMMAADDDSDSNLSISSLADSELEWIADSP